MTRTCKRFVSFTGRDKLVERLGPADFAGYKAEMAKRWNIVAVGNEMVRVRSLMRWCHGAPLVVARGKATAAAMMSKARSAVDCFRGPHGLPFSCRRDGLPCNGTPVYLVVKLDEKIAPQNSSGAKNTPRSDYCYLLGQ